MMSVFDFQNRTGMEPPEHSTESRRLRVLLSAYACEPGKGSEPGVGWNWARQLARWDEIWVLTRANNRGPIEQALATEAIDGAHFVFYDLPRWLRFWKKQQRGIRLYYYLWQVGAYFQARALHRKVNFDVAHHVTFVKYWMPSLLSLLPIPLVWGPVGGGESMPRSFRGILSWRGRVYETLRDIARAIGERDPLVRLTARRAALTLATTEASRARLIALGCRHVRVYGESGLAEQDIGELTRMRRRTDSPFRLLSSGNLLHLKGFELSLRAFAKVVEDGLPCEYWLLGDGPERRRLESLAAQLGVKDRVVFWGRLKRDQALEKLADCEVLVHPSLHDSGGWVCLEAMAAGRPIICLDLGGPGFQVTEATGIKVAALTPAQVVSDMVTAIKRISQDVELRTHLADGGRKRVREEFTWGRKGELMRQTYCALVASFGKSH
jgi:glycosyltransferase involved in cell wall biosynthesis